MKDLTVSEIVRLDKKFPYQTWEAKLELFEEMREALAKTVQEFRYALENHCALLKIPKSTINDNIVVIEAESILHKAEKIKP